MFGDFFLVSIFTNKTYLPEGNWINYWTGKKYTGKQEVTLENQIHGGPLFVKAGAIIPMQKTMQYIGEYPADTIIVKIYPENQSSYTLLEDDGISFCYEKGKIASTRFRCNKSKGMTEFLIEPVNGKYDGISNRRWYELEFEMNDKPSGIVVNGRDFNDWKYESNGNIKLTIEVVLSERIKLNISTQ